MGCYLIKDICTCVSVEKENQIVKSSARKSESSSPESSEEHNIWGDAENLQKEFAHSISKAVNSEVGDSQDLSASEKDKLENLTMKTVQVERKQSELEVESNVETKNKRKAFIKAKTVGQ